MRTTEVPRKTAQLLATREYQVSLALIATKPELSYLSTLIRYEELHALDPSQARATPKEHHDGIVEHLVDNLRELENDKIFNQIQIYKEINRVFTILKYIKSQQQKFYTNAYLENGTRWKKRC